MRNLFILLLAIIGFIAFSCDELGNEEDTARFDNLTSNVWDADSLIVNGVSAGGAGELLEKFNGEAVFDANGTGKFGDYEGTWYFTNNDKKIVIASDSLLIPLTLNIEELTQLSLKLTTVFPDFNDLTKTLDIRMTFKTE